MAFGGFAVTSATGTTLALNGVTAGATICVLPVDLNGNATSFGATENSGAVVYSTRGPTFGTSGDTNSQLLILTNAAGGNRTISVTAAGDTVEGLLAFWYTGVGDVDNSLTALITSQPTMSAVKNNGTSGNFTPITQGSTIIGVAINLVSTTAPTTGTSPYAFTSQSSGNISGINGYLIEDATWIKGTTNAAFQYGAGSNATGIVGFALQNTAPGASNIITPTYPRKKSRQGGLTMDLNLTEWY